MIIQVIKMVAMSYQPHFQTALELMGWNEWKNGGVICRPRK